MVMLYSAWLKLPIDTRHKLAQIFKIPKTGATEVANNEVVKDGYAIHDIDNAITKENLQQFLGSTQDNYMHLWEDTINKIEGRGPVIRESFTAATEEEPISTTLGASMNNGGFVGALPPVKLSVEEIVTNAKAKNKGGRPRKPKA